MTSWKDCTNEEYECLRNSRPYWNCMDLETHQKKLGPDCHRLKTMVKRSIEQEIRNKNFGNRSGNFEKNAMVKNQGTKTACTKNSWRLLAMGNQRAVCERRTIAVSATIWISVEKVHHQFRLRILSCGRMSENHREPEVPEAEAPVVERLDGLARITLEELAITHFVKKWHKSECLFVHDQEWLSVWGKLLIRTSSGWWTTDEKV